MPDTALPTPLPVVIACGQLLTGRVFEPQIAALSTGRQIQLADHQSDDSIAGMAARLLAAAPPRFALAGHAMGGFIALEVMRMAPERVARLALISTLAPNDGPAQTERRQGYIKLVEEGRFDQIIEQRIPMLFSPTRRTDARLLAIARDMAAATGEATFLRQQRAIMGRADSRPSLAAIRVPTLLLWGDTDGITTRAHQDELRQGIPGAHLDVIAGAGHLLTLEEPEQTTAALARWLDQD